MNLGSAAPMLTKQFIFVLLFAASAGNAAAEQKPTQAEKSDGEAVPAAQQFEVARLAADAGAAMREGDFSRAIAGYEKLVKLAPRLGEFHANLGVAYYSAGRFSDAARECREALRLKSGLANAHYFLGLALAEGGACRDALPFLERDYARVADSELKRTMGTAALRCAMALNQTGRALDFVRALTRDFPGDPGSLYLASHVYSDLATRSSERLLESAPDSPEAHQLNAEVLELEGKSSEAMDEYRKVLELNPRAPGVHYRLGRLLLGAATSASTINGAPTDGATAGAATADSEARREFEAELAIYPGSAEAEYELGDLDQRAREWNAAIGHFERALKFDPAFAQALVGLGKSLVSAGRAADAVRPLEAAVKLAPDDPVAHYQLAFAYRRVGREAEAEKELAAYRMKQAELERRKAAIRSGILGRMTEPQTAQPPE